MVLNFIHSTPSKKKNNHPFLTNIIWLYQHIILAPQKKKKKIYINNLVINLE